MLASASQTKGLGMLAWFQGWEIVIILAALLLLFGGKKLPELARGLARSLRIFKDELHGVKTDVEGATKDNQADQKTDAPKPPDKPAG
jgi:sec-independent protein translocase protein TatA